MSGIGHGVGEATQNSGKEFTVETTTGTYCVIETQICWKVHSEEWDEMFDVPIAVPRETLASVITLVEIERRRSQQIGEELGRSMQQAEIRKALGL